MLDYFTSPLDIFFALILLDGRLIGCSNSVSWHLNVVKSVKRCYYIQNYGRDYGIMAQCKSYHIGVDSDARSDDNEIVNNHWPKFEMGSYNFFL